MYEIAPEIIMTVLRRAAALITLRDYSPLGHDDDGAAPLSLMGAVAAAAAEMAGTPEGQGWGMGDIAEDAWVRLGGWLHFAGHAHQMAVRESITDVLNSWDDSTLRPQHTAPQVAGILQAAAAALEAYHAAGYMS